jgi:uroporphyrinogen III methyltransferase/synthase
MLHGAAPDLPVAVVQDGTISTQRTVTGTLTNVTERVVQAGLQSPCLTIIGDVVKLHDSLAWYRNTASRGSENMSAP